MLYSEGMLALLSGTNVICVEAPPKSNAPMVGTIVNEIRSFIPGRCYKINIKIIKTTGTHLIVDACLVSYMNHNLLKTKIN